MLVTTATKPLRRLAAFFLAAALVIPALDAQLASDRNKRWRQGNDGLIGRADDFDFFGNSVAGGDFNGDGFDDLAIGTPGENGRSGTVSVIYGSAAGLTPNGNQRWRQGVDGIVGGSENGDLFGAAVAAGDFNDDGFDDLAIGTPGEDSSSGSVHVILGSAVGLISAGNVRWRQGDDGIIGEADNNEFLGNSLDTGDFNNDGFDDLAIGVPGERRASGAVNVIYGSRNGLSGDGNQRWQQEQDGIIGERADNDFFGTDVAAGDFNSDGFADLAVGAPGENDNSGSVNVIYGSANGLSGNGNQRWRQGSEGIIGQFAERDRFGGSVAAGDFNNDGFDDVAIGVPGEDNSAGSVNVIYGAAQGLISNGNQRWRQGSDGIIGQFANNDVFGSSVATGDFNHDGFADLAIGVPGEDNSAGSVNVIYGTRNGLAGDGNQRWRQGSEGIEGSFVRDDAFGSSVATADFDNDGAADLAIGVPGEDAGAGSVNVIFGVGSGGPVINGVVGGGLSVPPVNHISSRTIISIFGANFAPPGTRLISELVNGRVPAILGGVCVEANGQPAPLFFINPTQINLQAPILPLANIDLEVILNCGQAGELRSNRFRVAVDRVSPEFFFVTPSLNGVNPIAAFNETTRRFIGALDLRAGVTEPAAPRDVVTVFMTGLGPTNPGFQPGELPPGAARTVDTVRARIGGIPVSVIYAGVTPFFAGLYQVSFRVPDANEVPDGNLPVVVEVGDVAATTVATPPGGFLTIQR